MCTLAAAQERAPVKCTEDSPERRGQEGCTILTSRTLVGSVKKALYWHIDRFESLDAAKKAAGPNGVAVEAHGSVWLMTVEPTTKRHHGGRHVAWVGPLALPAADSYTMRVQSSLLLNGAMTPVHTHSGPEVFYIVAGEQCLETEQVARRLGAGQSYILPARVIHRGRVTASVERRAFGLVLHDAAQPASHNLDDAPPLAPCK
jgi:quercetin dioxygenase-like cupin family protein